MRYLRWALEPFIGVALLWTWLGSISTPIAWQEIPMRSDMQTTSVYAIGIAAVFALAIALARVAPIWSAGLAAAALIAQVLGWASRFSQTAWDAYLMLLALAALLAVHARGRTRRIVVIGAIPAAVVVAALLTLPWLSLSGAYGTINGATAAGPEVWEGLVLCTVVPLMVAALVWRGATRLAARPSENRADAVDPLDALSPRERDIYLRVAQGMTNAEIAAAAHIEESTVKTHVGHILGKLALTSRTGIVAHAYRTGALPAGRLA
jgi:DNA-binding CsgD family transcriptional regulator